MNAGLRCGVQESGVLGYDSKIVATLNPRLYGLRIYVLRIRV